ncbi:MAG: YraN family protein [Candidatus Aminicenantaceae bacterium]
MKKSAHALGKSGEETALEYLKNKNYRIIKRNYRFLRGEIDIIAYDKNTLVFIEVKTRRSKVFGLPEESVTPRKQNQIRKIAQGFLAKNDLKNIVCRFDVLSLSCCEKDGYKIKHIQNAF